MKRDSTSSTPQPKPSADGAKQDDVAAVQDVKKIEATESRETEMDRTPADQSAEPDTKPQPIAESRDEKPSVLATPSTEDIIEHEAQDLKTKSPVAAADVPETRFEPVNNVTSQSASVQFPARSEEFEPEQPKLARAHDEREVTEQTNSSLRRDEEDQGQTTASLNLSTNDQAGSSAYQALDMPNQGLIAGSAGDATGHGRNGHDRNQDGGVPSRNVEQPRDTMSSARGYGSTERFPNISSNNQDTNEPKQSRSEQERRYHDRAGPTSRMGPPPTPLVSQSHRSNANFERTSVNGDARSTRNGISIRGQGEERMHRNSHPGSPPAEYESRMPKQEWRDERRGEPYDRRPYQHELRDQSQYESAPTMPPTISNGPRNPFSDRSGWPGDLQSRDQRLQAAQPYNHIDMDHGRLKQDDGLSSRHYDPVAERSDGPRDTPLGPRNSRNPVRITQGSSGPPVSVPSQVNSSSQPPRQPSVNDYPAAEVGDRPTPKGPAERTHSRKQSFQETPPVPGGGSSNTTDDTSGVHPDRLALVSPSSEGSGPGTSPFAQRQIPVHSSPPSAVVPSGPRASAPIGAPSGPAPSSRGLPPGPQQSNGRNNRHPLAAVNTTLQQAGQGPSIRGRSGGRFPSGVPMSNSNMPNNNNNNNNNNSMSDIGQGARSELSVETTSRDQGPTELFPGRDNQDTNRYAEGQSDRFLPRGRRRDLMDEADGSGRTSSRHSGRSRTQSPGGDGPTRRNEQGYSSSSRDHARDRPSDMYHHGMPSDGRGYTRERERGSGRDTRRGGMERSEFPLGSSREQPSRRGDGPDLDEDDRYQRRQQYPQQHTPGALSDVLRRRSPRRHASGHMNLGTADFGPDSSSLPATMQQNSIPQPTTRSGEQDRPSRREYPSGPALTRDGRDEKGDRYGNSNSNNNNNNNNNNNTGYTGSRNKQYNYNNGYDDDPRRPRGGPGTNRDRDRDRNREHGRSNERDRERERDRDRDREHGQGDRNHDNRGRGPSSSSYSQEFTGAAGQDMFNINNSNNRHDNSAQPANHHNSGIDSGGGGRGMGDNQQNQPRRHLPPRKHRRTDDPSPYSNETEGGSGGGGGGGGMRRGGGGGSGGGRMVSENKRPRRNG